MREIKFRAKRLFDRKWVYGSGVLQADDYCVIDVDSEMYEAETYLWAGATHIFRLAGAKCDTMTLGQYTGFKDYYGREIYEGDVISSMIAGNNPVYHVIIWHPQSASFRARLVKQGPPVDHCGIHMEWINKFHNEVIGNVHDNKEFLEE